MQVTQAMRQRICEMARRDGTIPAVKELRRMTGVSLQGAVRVLEQWMAEAGPVSVPSAPAQPQRAAFQPSPPPTGSNQQVSRPPASSGSMGRVGKFNEPPSFSHSQIAGAGTVSALRTCPPDGDFTKLVGARGLVNQSPVRGTPTGGNLTFWGLILRLLGFLLIGLAGVQEWEQFDFRKEGVEVQGRVTDFSPSGKGLVPVVEFNYQDWPMSVRGKIAFVKPAYEIGESVAVIYQPESGLSRIVEGTERWFVPLLLAGAGVFVLLISGFKRNPQ